MGPGFGVGDFDVGEFGVLFFVRLEGDEIAADGDGEEDSAGIDDRVLLPRFLESVQVTAPVWAFWQ